MASVLVHTATLGAHPSSPSAAALAAGRLIASELGATLCAAAPLAVGVAAADLVAALGRGGADRVELLPPAPPGPPHWSPSQRALVEVARRVAPRLVLFAAGDRADDVAARLAACMGASYFAEAQLGADPREPALERLVDGRRAALRLRLSNQRTPLVATLVGGAPGAAVTGQADIPHGIAPPPPDAGDGVAWLAALPAPGHALDRVDAVVGLGAGATDADLPLARELAGVLGAELAGTVAACRRGLVSPERAIGLGARRISPRLYVACAASGSRPHLAALGPATTIVALNRDADAPIFRAASYGMVGELGAVVPALLATLRAGDEARP